MIALHPSLTLRDCEFVIVANNEVEYKSQCNECHLRNESLESHDSNVT